MSEHVLDLRLSAEDEAQIAACYPFPEGTPFVTYVSKWQDLVKRVVSSLDDPDSMEDPDVFWEEMLQEIEIRIVIEMVLNTVYPALQEAIAAAVTPSDEKWMAVTIPVSRSIVGWGRDYYVSRGAPATPYWFELRIPQHAPDDLIASFGG